MESKEHGDSLRNGLLEQFRGISEPGTKSCQRERKEPSRFSPSLLPLPLFPPYFVLYYFLPAQYCAVDNNIFAFCILDFPTRPTTEAAGTVSLSQRP